MLYHVTAENRLPNILKEGLSPSATTLSSEYWEEKIGHEEDEFEEEYFIDCNTEAQQYLDEELNRGENVYFTLSKERAYEIMVGLKDLPYKNVVLEVNPEKIPCTCMVSDQSIADEIYDEYYRACIYDILVDYEKIEKLVEEWEKTLETYDPNKKYENEYLEVACPCHIPTDAIERVFDERGIEICRKDEYGKLVCDKYNIKEIKQLSEFIKEE